MKIRCPDCAWTYTGVHNDVEAHYHTHRIVHRGVPDKPFEVIAMPDTPTCKADGCDKPRVEQYGIYGGLCKEHRAEKKADRSQATPVPSRNGLVQLAQELERAREYVELARTQLDNAEQAEAKAVEKLREAIA